MNLWKRFWWGLAKRAQDLSGITLTDPRALEIFGVTPTASGIAVTEATALNSTAVLAAVRILAESVGFLPLVVYERLSGHGRNRAVEHPLYRLLHDQPNEYMTSVTFRETLQGHLATWGNAYAEIQWGANGQPIALWPLLPNQVRPQILDGVLRYQVASPKGPTVVLSPWDVLHIPGLGFDGLMGYSPIRLARQAIGLGMAVEEYGARFFANDATPGGILEHPGLLTQEAHDRLKRSWEDSHRGLSQARRMSILEEGMKFNRTSIPNEDAQFLETRKFQVTEIARIFRIPPHMLADLEKATFSNIEHQSLEFVIFTLGPWLRRWEQELNRKLFSTQAQKRYFIEFNVEGLLRGDIKTRYEAYAVARQWGWITPNDICERENLNPIPPDKGGDDYLQPVNYIAVGKQPPPTLKSEGTPNDASNSK